MRLRTRSLRSASTRTAPESHNRSHTSASAGCATVAPATSRCSSFVARRAGRDGFAEPGANIGEQRILVRRTGRQQLLAHRTLDVLEPAAPARDAARNPLRQIRMPPGPRADAIHQCLRELGSPPNATASRYACSALKSSGSMISASASAESGHACRKRAQRRAAREHERQPREVGLATAAFVAAADCVEKIRRERQIERSVDLVDEHDDRRRRVRQDDFPEKLDEPILGDRVVFAPPRADVDFELELRGDALGDAAQTTICVSSPICSAMPRRSTVATKVPAARSDAPRDAAGSTCRSL